MLVVLYKILPQRRFLSGLCRNKHKRCDRSVGGTIGSRRPIQKRARGHVSFPKNLKERTKDERLSGHEVFTKTVKTLEKNVQQQRY